MDYTFSACHPFPKQSASEVYPSVHLTVRESHHYRPAATAALCCTRLLGGYSFELSHRRQSAVRTYRFLALPLLAAPVT